MLDSGGSQASFLMQAFTLTKRSFINMSRDFGYYWLRLVIYIVVTVCIGTIYLDVGTSYNSILVFTGRDFSFSSFIEAHHNEIMFYLLTSIYSKYCYVTGKGFMCVFCLWLCHVHVHWWVSIFRRRYEGDQQNLISYMI